MVESSRNLGALGVPVGGGGSVEMPRRRWLTRVGVPVGVMVCVAALLAAASREALFPARSVTVVHAVAKPVTVNVTTASDAAGAVTVQAPGWVEPDPYPIYATALADGVVKEVLVLEGERVTAGQPVARLVDDDARLALVRAEATLVSRQADLAHARAQLAAARTDWQNPVARDRQVAVMQAQLDEVRAELAQLPATIAERRAVLEERRMVAERLARFVRGNAATEVEAAEARYRTEAAEAALNAQTQRQAILEAQVTRYEAELAAAQRDRELRVSEKLALDAAEAAVAAAESAVKQAEAELAEAQLRLERMTVRAPADGVVMTRLVAPGAKVMLASDMPHSAHVVHLYDPMKQQVRIDIPLADAAKVRIGQRAKIIVDVLPNREFDGVVTRVVHEADIQRNTLQVKVAIENPDEAIKPEMLARAKFLAMSESSESTVMRPDVRAFVPQDVVADTRDGRGSVWLVDAIDQTAKKVEVTLGTGRHDGWVEIASGVNPGDAVIVDTRGLTIGTRVRVAAE